MKKLPKILKAVFLLIFICQMIGLIVLLIIPALSQAADPITFTPQVTIGDFEKGTAKPINPSSIGEYIQSIYKYAIGIVGILAAVVLMMGGVIWLTAGGNQTRVGEAKAWIGASLTGLIIALTSYMILATVNPALVEFRPINMAEVEGTGCCDKLKSGENGCKMVQEKDCEQNSWYKDGWSCTDNTGNGMCTNLPTEGPPETIYRWKCLQNFTTCEKGTTPPSITYERLICKTKIGVASECNDPQYPQSICCGLSGYGSGGSW